MKEIKSALNYQESNLTSFNNSLHQLSARLEEQKNQTAVELAQLQASLSNHQLQTNDQLLATTQYLQDNLTYQLRNIHDQVVQLLAVHSCGGTGGWRRVVYLNMTDPTSTCPCGWQLTGYSKRTCGRANSGSRTCNSATFPVSGGEYTKLCGKIKAYQWGGPHAFLAYHNGQVTTIDGAYAAGVSLTHGCPRQHIWTFASGATDSNPTEPWICPCDASINITIPPFVGEDYFCETGIHESWMGSSHQIFHPNDPLWDGEGCSSSISCCSLHDPPYFVKQLSAPTTDNIEARICLFSDSTNEDIAVELVELYVQ